MDSKISSMLDNISNSLEAKGCIKEAYELDKIADIMDKMALNEDMNKKVKELDDYILKVMGTLNLIFGVTDMPILRGKQNDQMYDKNKNKAKFIADVEGNIPTILSKGQEISTMLGIVNQNVISDFVDTLTNFLEQAKKTDFNNHQQLDKLIPFHKSLQNARGMFFAHLKDLGYDTFGSLMHTIR